PLFRSADGTQVERSQANQRIARGVYAQQQQIKVQSITPGFPPGRLPGPAHEQRVGITLLQQMVPAFLQPEKLFLRQATNGICHVRLPRLEVSSIFTANRQGPIQNGSFDNDRSKERKAWRR